MRIIILGTAYPYRGGIAALNERMALQFQAEGHTVETYTFTLQYPDILFPGKTQYSENTPPKDLSIYRKVSSINPFNWISVGREIKKQSPDLLLIRFWIPFMAPCLGTIARIVRRNKHTKVVSIVDNIIPHEKRIGDHALANYFVRSSDAFVAMSKSVLSELNTFDAMKPKKFCFHPVYDIFGNALPREKAAENLHLDPSYFYFMFFGFIRDYKGLDLLMRAYADERLDKSKVRLLVVGEFYNNSEKYFSLEKELHLEGKIEWRSDYVPDDQVCNYFCLSDLVVQPYKTATQSGITQIAYHFEKPMLVTNVGGLPEIVPNGKVGYVVEPKPREIADAMLKFYNERPDFSKGLAEEKQNYSWEKLTRAITEAAEE